MSRTPAQRVGGMLELRRWLLPERVRLLPGAAAVVLVGLSALTIPAALKQVLDVLLERPSTTALVQSAAVLALLFLINGIAGYFQGVLFHESAIRVAQHMRLELAGRWLRWPLSRHHRHDIGSLITIETSDVEAVHQVVAHGLAPLVQNGLTFAGGLLVMTWLSWPIALGIMLLLALPAAWIRWHTRETSAGFRRSHQALEHAGGILQSAIAAIADVKRFGADVQLRTAIAEQLELGSTARLNAQRKQSSSSQVLYLMFCLVTLLVLVGGGLGRSAYGLGGTDVLVLFVYAYTVAQASISLYRTLGLFREARPALERITEMLALEAGEEAEEAGDQIDAIDAAGHAAGSGGVAPGGVAPGGIVRADVARGGPLPAGRVEVRGLEFRYPGQAGLLLEGLELIVEPGQWVVITGPSGSGKSTLLALLSRLYQPERGEIQLEGQQLEGVPRRVLRQWLGVAPQAPGVFPGSVESNVRLGRADVSDEAVREALEVAQLTGLPDLDARGLNLSGGQQARLGIARALAGRPSILALDEATGGLDGRTEQAFWAALKAIGRGRTTLIVTHRPERVPEFDALYRLVDRRLERVFPADGETESTRVVAS